MKHLLSVTIAIAATTGAMAQTAEQKVIFKGTADKTYDGNMIMMYNNSTKDFDSAVVKDGSYEIAVNFKEPTRYYFYSKYEAKAKGGYAPWGILVTRPGEIKMKTQVDSMAGTTVSGAPENEVYNKYNAVSAALQKKVMEQLKTTFGKGVIDSLSPKNPKYKEVIAEYQRLNSANQPAEKERLEKFITANPNSFASLYLLSGASNSMDVETLEKLYNKTGKEYKDSKVAKSLANKINAAKITAIGKIAPEFSQPDTLGKEVALKDFRGKYVLVDFWASWCGPCRAENPNVVKAFNKYKDKDFTVLGVSLDRPGAKDNWLAAIHKDDLTWTHVSDLKFWDNAVAKLYGIQAIPQNYLLDKEGKIIASNIRGEELEKKLEELIK